MLMQLFCFQCFDGEDRRGFTENEVPARIGAASDSGTGFCAYLPCHTGKNALFLRELLDVDKKSVHYNVHCPFGIKNSNTP